MNVSYSGGMKKRIGIAQSIAYCGLLYSRKTDYACFQQHSHFTFYWKSQN